MWRFQVLCSSWVMWIRSLWVITRLCSVRMVWSPALIQPTFEGRRLRRGIIWANIHLEVPQVGHTAGENSFPVFWSIRSDQAADNNLTCRQRRRRLRRIQGKTAPRLRHLEPLLPLLWESLVSYLLIDWFEVGSYSRLRYWIPNQNADCQTSNLEFSHTQDCNLTDFSLRSSEAKRTLIAQLISHNYKN